MRLAALFAILILLGTGVPAAAPDPNSGTVSGRVLYEDATAAPFARLVFLPGGWNVTTNLDGHFTTTLPAGSYTLRASGGGAISESNVTVVGGQVTVVVVKLDRSSGTGPASTGFAFVFLFASMIAVAIGGFYVNRRMAESGLDVNKTIMGGATVRKPFRRRSKKRIPPPSR